ncbi:hypothetical protein [Paraliobacillus sp. JSM ZJ581]|uniref:hypothetical protein n=1 Tax=Paraliobacillus sp. JSM ZJ581 TaxID=3342118 RepID=UPI0035A82868
MPLYVWTENYENYGPNGLNDSKTCKTYFKDLNVGDYLSGVYSHCESIRKHEISISSVQQKKRQVSFQCLLKTVDDDNRYQL